MHDHTRRDFLKKAGMALAASSLLPGCAIAGGRKRAARKKPNIIYILADDLGYGDLGCFGQKAIKTPNIDKLATEGMKLTDHYAGSTVCAPSRCCLMTGLHTGHAYVRGNREAKPMGQLPLPADTATLPKLLKTAGYKTALIGKWGLGGPESNGIPNKQGFDYFFGYLCQRHAHNYYPEFLFRNNQKVPLEGNKIANPRPDGAGVAVERAQYSHDLVAAEALEFVEQNREGPFFLYLALTIPHANNEAGNKGMEVPDLGQYADKDWPEPQKGHAAMITRMDGDIGRLMAKLKALGIDKNTLVIFTSDNGPHAEGGANPRFNNSSGPLRGYKRDLYEGGIRVPTIARWPGRIKPGSTSDHISAFWDILPTCCDIAGIDTPEGIDGISMLPTFLGKPKKQKKHEYMYWEFHSYGKRQAVRVVDFKGIRLNVAKNPDGPIELYNLKDDIGEKNNIAKDHPQIVEKITKIMKSARTPSKYWKMPGE
ncbi:MAG: sulfatase-like hydrolase/transferase [Planctomycetota bacterium]|jgi:arylsulfatase A-like enzyme